MCHDCHLPNAYEIWLHHTISFAWGGGSLLANISEGRRRTVAVHRPPTNVGVKMIALSCGIKITAVHHLVLSQYTHLTDGWTDRIVIAILCAALHAVAQ